jgi:hypothetical protein
MLAVSERGGALSRKNSVISYHDVAKRPELREKIE